MKSEKELRERQGEGEGGGRGEEKGEEKVEGERITESPPVCLYFQTGSCYESRFFVCLFVLFCFVFCYLTLEINSVADKSLLIRAAFDLQMGQGTPHLRWWKHGQGASLLSFPSHSTEWPQK